eukprot:m.885031 g.885031  ORF g.885031 m.885031 type:complete len:495 (-) comp59895_c0_seq2:41-1525(-)
MRLLRLDVGGLVAGLWSRPPSWPVVAGSCSLALLAFYGCRACFRRSSGRAPPRDAGWLPFIGQAVAFGKEPLVYIKRCFDKFGPVFTIFLAGQEMTYVLDPALLETFFNSEPAISFQAAVQPFTQKAGGIPAESFRKFHTAGHDAMKGRLAPAPLEAIFRELAHMYLKDLPSLQPTAEGQVSLLPWVRNCMFMSTVKCLFGPRLQDQEDMQAMAKTFFEFDNDFEYGTELPELFLPTWAKAKRSLLAKLSQYITGMHVTGTPAITDTLLEVIMKSVDPDHRHNYALLTLWATQANALPASFWTLAHLLTNPELMHELQDELTTLFGPLDDPAQRLERVANVSYDQLNKAVFLKSCILEGIRLYSPGVTPRRLTKDTVVGDYVVPKGNFLLISPYWIHRNPTCFPEPERFNPSRWSGVQLDKGKYLPGFVAFGGGRYQCPGRYLAVAEMQIFLIALLSLYALTAETVTVPHPSTLHLIGVQIPTAEFTVSFRRRV